MGHERGGREEKGWEGGGGRKAEEEEEEEEEENEGDFALETEVSRVRNRDLGRGGEGFGYLIKGGQGKIEPHPFRRSCDKGKGWVNWGGGGGGEGVHVCVCVCVAVFVNGG